MRNSRIKSSVAGLVLGLLTFSSLSYADTVQEECALALHHVAGSYMSYVQKAEDRYGSSQDKHPAYLNPQREAELVEKWKGEDPSALFAPYFPEGVTLITHSLQKASAPGVVKVEQPKGDFLILRVEMPFKGRIIATNVTVSAQALYGNLARFRAGEKRWLIGPDATAALDWGHGGGTKTTGGHTADTLMNQMSKFNVFTMGMDQPWHGNGPREWFEDFNEYLEFRIAFRKRFVHPDVPTFMIGHSYGGLIGDMVIRRSAGNGPQAQAIKEAYAGVIPLSFVADAKPGADFNGKTTASRLQEAEQKWEENDKRINEGDKDLFANLAAAAKCSPLSGLQCSQTGLYNNWEMDENILAEKKLLEDIPSMKTASGVTGFAQPFQDFLESDAQALKNGPVPSLWFMGEHDFLNVTNEENIETYVRRLKNAIYYSVSSRVHFRGRVDKVGHMIFDTYTPKKDHPEALAVMRAYLEAKNPELEIAVGEDSLKALFKEQVLKGVVGPSPYTHLTPTNEYASSIVLMAYHWVPEFTTFLDQRVVSQASGQKKSFSDFQAAYYLGYTEEKTFESYQVIRDFVAAVLKTRGVDMKVVEIRDRINASTDAGDPLAHMRETVMSIIKGMGNNLAFREFLRDLRFMEVPATPSFQRLNDVGTEITNRIRMLDVIRKEKISDEDKARKVQALGELENDLGEMLAPNDLQGMKDANARIHLIRNKNFIPADENREFATTNVAQRVQLAIDSKAVEAKRDTLRKGVKELRDTLDRKQKALEREFRENSSAKLDALEAKRVELFNSLSDFDFQQKILLEGYMVKVAEQGASWRESFKTLPPDLEQVFVDSEKASDIYQDLLKEIDATRVTEALEGQLGPEAQKLALDIHGEKPAASPGTTFNGHVSASSQSQTTTLSLTQQIANMSRKLDETEYVELAGIKEKSDRLLEAYVHRVLPNYFGIRWVSVREVLDHPNKDDKQFREDFKALETGLTQWRSRVLNSKPVDEATGLY